LAVAVVDAGVVAGVEVVAGAVVAGLEVVGAGAEVVAAAVVVGAWVVGAVVVGAGVWLQPTTPTINTRATRRLMITENLLIVLTS